MWTYDQKTGAISRNGAVVSHGYAGRGEGKNNPEMQHVRNVGPIPRGRYRIGQPHTHPRVGKYAMELTPMEGTEMFGRDEFFWHGENAKTPGNSSHGCIISDPATRRMVWGSADHVLEVV